MSLPLHYLETIVVCLGIFVLLAEAFAPRENKSYLGWISFIGLLVVFGLLIFATDAIKPGENREIDRFIPATAAPISSRDFRW